MSSVCDGNLSFRSAVYTLNCGTIRRNRMHYLLLVYFNYFPLHVSSRLTAHHQLVLSYIYSIWYMSSVYVDLLLAESLTILPTASMWVVSVHNLFHYSDPSAPCPLPSDWPRLFSSQTLSRINKPTFSTTIISFVIPVVFHNKLNWSVSTV